MDAKNVVQDVLGSLKESLSFSPSKVIGIDLGSSSIKVAELQRTGKNKYKLIKYAIVPLPEACFIEDEIQKEGEVSSALTSAIKKAKISGVVASLGLFGPNTVLRKIQLAGGSSEEIEDQITWEAEQYIPFPIEECNLSYHILGENEGGGIDALVAAARKDVVVNYKNLIEKNNIKVKVLDLSALALANVFEFVMGEQAQDPTTSWLLLDCGAQKTQVVIYRHRGPSFSKEIYLGGNTITEEIQRRMGVNYFEAEDLKNTTDPSGNLPEEVVEIVEQTLKSYFLEIKKAIDFYFTSTADIHFSGCFITGGASQISGFKRGLEETLGVSVHYLNPLDKIQVSSNGFSQEVLNSISLQGAVAIGLAMRDPK